MQDPFPGWISYHNIRLSQVPDLLDLVFVVIGFYVFALVVSDRSNFAH